MEFVYEHQAHKIAAFEEILKKTGAKEVGGGVSGRRFAGYYSDAACGLGDCGR